MNKLTRAELIERICPTDATHDCCQGNYSSSCDECEDILCYFLDRYDSKVRADVIDKINNAIEELLKEPQYQHEGEDWMNGLIMAQEILYNMQSELEEKNNG